MSKKQLLSDIVLSKSGLGIENVFGQAAWAQFEELQPNDGIVLVGNGPVPSHDYAEYIETAKLVVRCNHYSMFTTSDEGRRKIGSKCDVQFICLHGKEFKKAGLQFLYDWCGKNSKVVLALENSKARGPITDAIKQQQLNGDAILSKICLPEESILPTIFPVDCT